MPTQSYMCKVTRARWFLRNTIDPYASAPRATTYLLCSSDSAMNHNLNALLNNRAGSGCRIRATTRTRARRWRINMTSKYLSLRRPLPVLKQHIIHIAFHLSIILLMTWQIQATTISTGSVILCTYGTPGVRRCMGLLTERSSE